MVKKKEGEKIVNAAELPWPSPVLHPNAREHHMPIAQAKKKAKKDAHAAALADKLRAPDTRGKFKVELVFHPPSHDKLGRRAPRDRDEDGLVASMKAALDGVAGALGVDDSRFDLSHRIGEERKRPCVMVVIPEFTGKKQDARAKAGSSRKPKPDSKPKAKPKPAPLPDGMSREDVFAVLEGLGVDFKRNASNARLVTLMDAATAPKPSPKPHKKLDLERSGRGLSEGSKQTQFKPGESGNPAGRPKGARARLGEGFLAALADDFEEHGKTAIEDVRKERPQDYLKVIASTLPKELNVGARELDDLTDEELLRQLIGIAARLEEEGIDISAGIEAPEGTA